MLDVSVAYNRFRFLGQEFLTWLWYVIATEEYKQIINQGADLSLSIGDRMVLENRHSQEIEIITIKGNQADLKEGIVALTKGALVTELGLALSVDGQPWTLSLKGESLGMTNIKTPATGRPETPDDVEGAVLEKAHLYETIFKFTDQLYRFFIQHRMDSDWDNRVTPNIKKWIKKCADTV